MSAELCWARSPQPLASAQVLDIFRVVGKIFNDVEIKGWCKEQEQRNAAARQITPA